MNAVGRLEAAIEKLETLRGTVPESGAKEWSELGHSIVAYDGTRVADNVIAMDRDMILVLHRTIGAQLAILRNEVEDMEHESRPPYDDIWRLAFAILGES